MTLAFLGDTSPSERAAVMARADATRGAPFTMRFGRLAYWEGPGVVVLEPLHVPSVALVLMEAVRSVAGGIGRALPACRPHVTLERRKAAPGSALDADVVIDWAVQDFVLARSDPRSTPRYTILARWPLS